MQAKKFINFTDREFIHGYGGVPYTFKAGESIMLEDYKADHFCKHLVDREMDLARLVTSNRLERAKLENKCFLEEEVPVVSLPVEAKVTTKGKKVEKEFEDLKVEKKVNKSK